VFRVVGVVGNVKHFDLADAPLGTLYLPMHALPAPLRSFFAGNFTVAVAGDLDDAATRRRIAAAIQRVDPEVSASTMTSMREAMASAQSTRGFTAVLLGVFAATALLLAVAGLYAVVTAGAQSRRREFGVKLALGATPASVTRDVLFGAARTLAWGMAGGLPLAWAATQALGQEISPDLWLRPELWVGVVVTLAAAVFLAALLPARRASRLDVARTLGDG
jgi:ABC-type antimicrobial peptide transport system permease subunit